LAAVEGEASSFTENLHRILLYRKESNQALITLPVYVLFYLYELMSILHETCMCYIIATSNIKTDVGLSAFFGSQKSQVKVSIMIYTARLRFVFNRYTLKKIKFW